MQTLQSTSYDTKTEFPVRRVSSQDRWRSGNFMVKRRTWANVYYNGWKENLLLPMTDRKYIPALLDVDWITKMQLLFNEVWLVVNNHSNHIITKTTLWLNTNKTKSSRKFKYKRQKLIQQTARPITFNLQKIKKTINSDLKRRLTKLRIYRKIILLSLLLITVETTNEWKLEPSLRKLNENCVKGGPLMHNI